MAAAKNRFAKYAIALAVVAAIAVAAFVFLRSGRGGGYDAAKDENYQVAVKDVLERRKPLVRARNATEDEMRRTIARARAALPEGATDDEVKAELEGNPEKYPEWKGLNERIAKDNAAIENSLKEAQALVRARIMRETRYGKKQ